MYNEQVASTVWSIMAPYDKALCHESRVILRSEPIDTETIVEQTVAYLPSCLAYCANVHTSYQTARKRSFRRLSHLSRCLLS